MMGLFVEVDTSKALRKLKHVSDQAVRAADIAEERGAHAMKRHMQQHVPVVSGRLKRSVTVQERNKRHFVKIPRHRFPRFYYPILLRDRLRKIIRRGRTRTKQVMKAVFLSHLRKEL